MGVYYHPIMLNLYALLSKLDPNKKDLYCFDLKDVFFLLPAVKVNQPVFTFDCTDTDGQLLFIGQLTWTWLPQGLLNSPTLFDEALRRDLIPYLRSYL